MSQKQRVFSPGSTYYISLQGPKGMTCFFDEPCYQRFLLRLLNCLRAYQVKLHGYVLLPDAVQLLMTPATPAGITGLMKISIGSYTQYYNERFERDAPLWPGDFRATLLESNGQVLECQKLIELAPVRADLVSCPSHYRWSSYYINAFGGHGEKLTMHQQYINFGRQALNRFEHYRDFVTGSNRHLS